MILLRTNMPLTPPIAGHVCWCACIYAHARLRQRIARGCRCIERRSKGVQVAAPYASSGSFWSHSSKAEREARRQRRLQQLQKKKSQTVPPKSSDAPLYSFAPPPHMVRDAAAAACDSGDSRGPASACFEPNASAREDSAAGASEHHSSSRPAANEEPFHHVRLCFCLLLIHVRTAASHNFIDRCSNRSVCILYPTYQQMIFCLESRAVALFPSFSRSFAACTRLRAARKDRPIDNVRRLLL